jgi:hypothetical protein
MYDELEIKLMRKDGIRTFFSFKNNETAIDFEKLSKVFCLFTVCIFQTDSEYRHIVYKKNNTYYCETIDDLCKHYYNNELGKECETIVDNASFFSYDEFDSIIGHVHYNDTFSCEIEEPSTIYDIWESESETESESELETESESKSESDSESESNSESETKSELKFESKSKNKRVRPGIHITFDSSNYVAEAMVQDRSDKEFWHLEKSKCVLVDQIYNVSRELEEDMGNYGQYICSETETLIDGFSEERYSIFNFDTFEITSTEVLDSMRYDCTFTPIPGTHHAASMMAQSCTVKYTLTDIELKLINEVNVYFKLNTDKTHYDVVTIYYGIDVL